MKFKHVKTNSGTHVFYTKDCHLSFYGKRSFKLGVRTGASLKRRLRNGTVKHYTLTYMEYNSRESGIGWIRHFEAGTHRAGNFDSGRVPKSKRYVRVKVCLGPQRKEYKTR